MGLCGFSKALRDVAANERIATSAAHLLKYSALLSLRSGECWRGGSACLNWQPLSPGSNRDGDSCQLQGQELSFCYLWVQCCALRGSGPPWWPLDLTAVRTAAALNLKRLLQTKVCGQACTDGSGCPSLALWAGFPEKQSCSVCWQQEK